MCWPVCNGAFFVFLHIPKRNHKFEKILHWGIPAVASVDRVVSVHQFFNFFSKHCTLDLVLTLSWYWLPSFTRSVARVFRYKQGVNVNFFSTHWLAHGWTYPCYSSCLWERNGVRKELVNNCREHIEEKSHLLILIYVFKRTKYTFIVWSSRWVEKRKWPKVIWCALQKLFVHSPAK